LPTVPDASSDTPLQQYVTALEASTVDYVKDAAVGTFNIPSGVVSMALVAVAAVAGGAFIL
jgi:hypothetical protein